MHNNMKDQIDDYFNKGLVVECFQAERNILIWQYVADEVEFLETQNKDIQQLYSFIQLSAQTNFILCLGKIFDNPSKKFPTRCILSFLDLINSSSLEVEIVETSNTIKLLIENDCPTEMIDSVKNNNSALFPKLFVKHYRDKYESASLKQDIETLKLMRDKVAAHNEAVGDLYIDFKTTERLIGFASEIIAIFGMAYHSAIWRTDNFSFIKRDAERNALFIKSNIERLKNK